jgi:hypothetical protein
MIFLIMIIAFTASMISVAWVLPRKRAVRMDREAAEDAAIRDLYDHYMNGVDSLTQAYLLQAPSDEEWLARIRDQAAAAARERPRQTLCPEDLRILAFRLMAMHARASVRRCDMPVYGHEDSEESPHRVSHLVLLAGALVAAATFCVLSHLAASSLLLILGIATLVALGAVAGHAIVLRPGLPGDPFKAERERAHPSSLWDDRHGPGE